MIAGLFLYVMIFFRTLTALLFIFASSALINPSFAQISVSAKLVQEGFVTISWLESEQVPAARVQIAIDMAFSELVRDLSIKDQLQVHLSGFDDGLYYARLVNTQGNPTTDTVLFEVRHRPLAAAVQLFLAGLALFVLLVAVMIRFTRS